MTASRAALKAATVAAIVVALMLALAAAARWWNGEPLGPVDGIALAALPLLAWLYLTKVSVFRRGGTCLKPDGEDRAARPPR
ncbi:MAG TPA: hypothetical protein VLW45_04670 [Pelomicrobium sp.]|nr:hypothetical protein [Pelomicrobium sp.]